MKNSISLTALYEAYKKWVIANPHALADFETLATWSSYFVAGRINKSPIVSELVYSISKLLTLFNDRLIEESYGGSSLSSGIRDKLRLWLTVLHYCEVFIELSVRSRWGKLGKWYVATILQIGKCSAALVLIYKYKTMPILYPAVPTLQRRKLLENKVGAKKPHAGVALRRSGKVLRRIEGSQPVAFRNWQPLEDSLQGDRINVRVVRLAETIHAVKPIAHLAAVSCFGSESWTQWLVAVALDLASLRLYERQHAHLPPQEKLEIGRRKLGLLLYLLRSPMYDRHSKNLIRKFLDSTVRKIPALRIIYGPIMQYMDHWQDIYFYMWTS